MGVRLITAGLAGPGLPGRGRDHVRRVLAARGMHLEEGHDIAVPDDVGADLVVWAESMTACSASASGATTA